jgi:hypothetical protein
MLLKRCFLSYSYMHLSFMVFSVFLFLSHFLIVFSEVLCSKLIKGIDHTHLIGRYLLFLSVYFLIHFSVVTFQILLLFKL